MFSGKVGIGSHGERAAQIAHSITDGQCGLLDGVAHAQQVPTDGEIESLFVEVITCLPCEQIGLVVAPLPAAAPVQGDRDQYIDRAENFIAQDRGSKKLAQEAVEVGLVFVFDGVNELSEQAGELAHTDDSGDHWPAVLAAMAAVVDEGVGSDVVATGRASGRRQGGLEFLPAA